METSKHSTPNLVFITQVASVKKSKEAATVIRKHVMRDIGKSRRKQRRYPRIRLELSEDMNISLPVRSLTSRHQPMQPVPGVELEEENGLLNSEQGWVPKREKTKPTRSESCSRCQYLQPQDEVNVSGSMGMILDRTWTGRIDPFVKFPVELNDRTRELVDLAFDDRYLNIGAFRDACLPVGLMDEAAFHQVLSNALLNISCRRIAGSKMETYDAMRHHALAINSINKRIRDVKNATSDGFIGAVIGFMCYHVHILRIDQAACRTHLKGVEELIRLRGGIETLDSNKLVRTLLGWSDVGGASIEDSQPQFPLPYKLLPKVDTLLPWNAITSQSDDIQTTWSSRFLNHMDLLTVMVDLLRFNNHLLHEIERTGRRVLSDIEFSTGYVYPLLHRVLSFAGDSLVAPPEDLNILQACRIGCALYLAGVRRLFGINGVISTLQTQKLQHYLRSNVANWEDLGLLKVWCLAMGGMEAEGELKDWYAREVQQEGSLMGWKTVEQLETQMKGMLWLPEVHTPALMELCKGLNITVSAKGSPPMGKWKQATHLQRFG